MELTRTQKMLLERAVDQPGLKRFELADIGYQVTGGYAHLNRIKEIRNLERFGLLRDKARATGDESSIYITNAGFEIICPDDLNTE